MSNLPAACLTGLTKTERYYQIYVALGGTSDCFFGLPFIDQLRLILELIGSEECIFTEWDFYASWLQSLSPDGCLGLSLDALQQAVYTILYEEAGSPSDLPSPDCFLGLLPNERDVAMIEIIIQSQAEIMFDLTKLTLSGPGNTNIIAPSSLLRTVLVGFSGQGFTASLSLQTENAKDGQLICIIPTWESGLYSTLQVFNDSIGGTKLYDYPAFSSSTGELRYVFDEDVGEWIKGGPNVIAFAIDPLSDLAVELLAYWRFTSGSFLVDSSGNSHTLTNTNGVTNPIGKIGDGAGFLASSSQRLSVTADLFGGEDTITVAAWVKGIGASMAIVGTLTMYFGTIGSNVAEFAVVSGGNATVVTGDAVPNDGAFHLVMAWKTPTAIFISVDNGTPATASITGAIDAATTLRLGNGGDGTQFATCTMDEVALWRRVLRSDERSAFYNAGAGAVIDV
jgi:hypothetical protein